ncbi:MAG: curli-like amyloid fiber formation chaperone CsgH [Hyphomicrobiaceae bacterium]|nr:curli-like amyloid fiber formation chaperone CsgH [Hyphomicrobiaceae bacterium]
MSTIMKSAPQLAAPFTGASILMAALAFGAAVTPGASDAVAGAGGPVSCAIKASHGGGGVTLRAVVNAPDAVSGTFRFRVAKSGGGGGANIDQSGDFSGAGSLAEVSLGGDGTFLARLSVTAAGKTIECSEKIAGAL